jgi:hypothetical protein
MPELTPPFLRSNHPPYRLRPRSAVTLMAAADEPAPGVIERLRQLARQVLSHEA